MARTRRVLQPVDNAAPADDLLHAKDPLEGGSVEDAIPPHTDGLESLMMELSGAMLAKITVYRINKVGPQSYCYTCTPDSFSLDDLRDRFGGGEFRLYIVKDNAFFRNYKVSVEKPINASAPAAAPAAAAEPPGMAELRAANAKLAAQVESMRDPGRVRSIFENLDLPATISAVSAMLVALRPPAPPPAPAPAPSEAMGLEMLLKGIELANELRANAEPSEGGLMGVVRDLIKSPILAQAVQAATPAQPPETTAMPRPAAPQVLHAKVATPPAPPPTAEAPGNEVFGPMRPALAKYLPLLCAKSAAESPSGLYAGLVVDSVPPEVLVPVLNSKTSAEIVNFLASVHPPVAQHGPWFVSLVDEMRMLYEDDDATDPESEDPPGHVGEPT